MWLITRSLELGCLDITPPRTRTCKWTERVREREWGGGRRAKRWAKHREGQYDVTAASFVAYTLVHCSRMQLTQPSLQLNARITRSATFVARLMREPTKERSQAFARNWFATIVNDITPFLQQFSYIVVVLFTLHLLASASFISFYCNFIGITC